MYIGDNMYGQVPCSLCGKLNTPGIEGGGCNCWKGNVHQSLPPGRSEKDCKECGKRHSIFYDCISTIHSVKPRPKAPTDLTKLYDELGTIKWIGVDKGWEEAIEAVRQHIKGKLI